MYCRNRPDVWIAPLQSVDGDRKWKVKRVWDVDDIDDAESEYEVDQLDLMSSIRDLLGVPDDLGATYSEWKVDIDESNPWETSAAKVVPPLLPRKPIFTFETVYDVDGLHDGAEGCVEMTAFNFEFKIQSIIETTIHDGAAEEVQYEDSNPIEPKQRAFNRPDEWVLPQDTRATPGRRSWKAKASQKVEEQVNACCRNSTDPPILEESSTERNVETRFSKEDWASSTKSHQQRRACESQLSSIGTPGNTQIAKEVGEKPPKKKLLPATTSMTEKLKKLDGDNDNQESIETQVGNNTCLRTKPTWEKQATGSPKRGKKEIKMWWHS